MKQNDKIQDEVNLTLESADRVGRADVNPFLFEKVIYRMEKNPDTGFNIRIKYVLAILILIVLNLFTVLHFKSENSDTESQSRIENFDEEYSVTYKLNYN
ncbi:MAG TPA: hypothetical protein PK447_10400 [Ignavibacteria bacterium]|nr:hypothetical protein [Ignavibacteria bacterium]